MAQVFNRKTGAVYGDPHPELDVCWLNGSITTPGKRAPQIPLLDAMKLLDGSLGFGYHLP